MKPRQGHYIRHNETTRVPRRHIILDTESWRTPDTRGEVQTWRLACATFLASEGRRESPEWSGRYEHPAELWEAVSGHCRPRKRTVVWAHNLSYDLRISQAFTHLPALGWQLLDVNAVNHGCWARWRRGAESLVMVDSTSVWPCSLEKIGHDLGIHKPQLPADDDDQASWWARCEADVEILTAAVKDYLAWIEDADLGNWQLTGAGQSWATWRHRFLEHKVLVHDNAEALSAERRAMWTGRCEVWRWGPTKAGGVTEWDLSNAYCRLALELEVPVQLVGMHGAMTLDRLDRLRRSYAVLAEVKVTTDTELVPTYDADRICWPVGTFTTTLWDPELQLLLEHGAQVEVLRCWTYRKAPALEAWAGWCLAQLDPASSRLSPIRQRVVKHWSRALIGRFAMRYRSWEPFGTTPDSTLELSAGIDTRTGQPYELLRAGQQVFQRSGWSESDNSVPAITGYIMSACRARLWQVMTAIGLDRVLYVDTDSVIVHADAQRAVERAIRRHPEWCLRAKRSWPYADLRGPRQLLLGAEARVAGVPRAATRTGPDTFTGELWQTLEGALRVGRTDSVLVRRSRWHIPGTDRRRAHLVGGRTGALVLGVPAGDTDLDAEVVQRGVS